jgi:hypothetical protein
MYVEPSPSSVGDWTIRDNLFDKVPFYFTGSGNSPPLVFDHDYNAYWLLQSSELNGFAPRLPVGTWDFSGAPHDQTLAAAPAYQTGAFGSFYLPSSLWQVGTGSRSPAAAGMFHFTTRTDQTEDSTQAKVNIGLHYPAALGSQPRSSLISGVPDYVADADGDGPVDSTEPPSPTPFVAMTKASSSTFQLPPSTAQLLPTVLPVLTNVLETEAFPLTVFYPSTVVSAGHGTFAPSSDCLNLVYTPSSSTYYGPDTFTYAVVNDFFRESSATATVFINQAGNQPPVASADQVQLGVAAAGADIAFSTLLSNDSDPDGLQSALTIFSVNQPRFGTNVVDYSGQIIHYSRNISIPGSDTFTYTITDGRGGCSVATVQVNRQDPVGNRPPVATSYSTTAVAGEPLNMQLIASDADGNAIVYNVTPPLHGTLTGTGADRVYTPDYDYFGPDSITFTASDGQASSSPATILIHVRWLNLQPVGNPLTVHTHQGTDISVIVTAWDVDSSSLKFLPPTSPIHGTLSGTAPNLTYTPTGAYTGWDSFTFQVNDGQQDSTPATVTIDVDASPPPGQTVAVADLFQAQQDTAVNLDVLANDTDSDAYALTVTSAGIAGHGITVVANGGLNVLYTPASGFFGVDTFTYNVSNGHGRTASAIARVFVNKTGNSPPSASSYSQTLAVGIHTVTISISQLLASPYCSDPDGDTLILDSLGSPGAGTASFDSGQISYSRDPSKFGSDAFTYIVTDANGGYDISRIIIDQVDSDGDGMPDEYELAHSPTLDKDTDDADLDPDEDGLPNLAEYVLGTDPNTPDNPLTFLALTEGVNLSGVVKLQIGLSSALPASLPITVYLDGIPANSGTVSKDGAGTWWAEIDTTMIGNGFHSLQMGLAYDTRQGHLDSMAYSEPNAHLIANAFVPDRLTRFSSDTLFVQGRLAIPVSSYTIDIYDEAGNHVTALSGVPQNGRIDASWELTSNGTVTSALTLQRPDGQPPLRIEPKAVPGEAPIPGDVFVVAYGYDSGPAVMLALKVAIGQGVVQQLNTGGTAANKCADYVLTPSTWNVPYANNPFQFSDHPTYKRWLLDALKDKYVWPAGNFYWWGHGTKTTIGPTAKTADNHNNQIHEVLDSADVANALGNLGQLIKRGGVARGHIFRLTILDCCLAYSKQWSEAFGCDFTAANLGGDDPAKWNHGSTDTVNDYARKHLQPRAFVAWDPETSMDDLPDVVSGPLAVGQHLLFNRWQNGASIRSAVQAYVSYLYSTGNGFDKNKAILKYGISGCWDLKHCDSQ